MPMENYILPWFLLVNLVTFFLYWLDKRAAYWGKARVPEKVLLFWIFLGGNIAALVASALFRHKTKKSSFKIKFALVMMLQFFIFMSWIVTST